MWWTSWTGCTEFAIEMKKAPRKSPSGVLFSHFRFAVIHQHLNEPPVMVGYSFVQFGICSRYQAPFPRRLIHRRFSLANKE